MCYRGMKQVANDHHHDVEKTAELLANQHIQCAFYHAGMTSSQVRIAIIFTN